MKKFLLIILFLVNNIIYAAQILPKEAKFDTGFSPNKGSLNIILQGIKSAKKQILIASYSFTSKTIALELINAKKRGIKIFLIADKNSNNKIKYSVIQFLSNQGVAVKLNGNYKIHHHKFMVIDNKHLELGSFNYSNSANNKNAENVLILWDVKPIAKIYAMEWRVLWEESENLCDLYLNQ